MIPPTNIRQDGQDIQDDHMPILFILYILSVCGLSEPGEN
jgi:hypothetical protein